MRECKDLFWIGNFDEDGVKARVQADDARRIVRFRRIRWRGLRAARKHERNAGNRSAAIAAQPVSIAGIRSAHHTPSPAVR